MQIRNTEKEGEILKNIVKSLFNAVLADRFQYLFERLIEGFLIFRNLKD